MNQCQQHAAQQEREEQKHTPEPFDYRSQRGDTVTYQVFSKHQGAAVAHCVFREEDARRIVACVNACAGMTTEEVESIPVPLNELARDYRTMRKHRDELINALQRIELEARHIASAHIIARTAIAKVKP